MVRTLNMTRHMLPGTCGTGTNITDVALITCEFAFVHVCFITQLLATTWVHILNDLTEYIVYVHVHVFCTFCGRSIL